MIFHSYVNVYQRVANGTDGTYGIHWAKHHGKKRLDATQRDNDVVIVGPNH
jgi:hypothetical protein